TPGDTPGLLTTLIKAHRTRADSWLSSNQTANHPMAQMAHRYRRLRAEDFWAVATGSRSIHRAPCGLVTLAGARPSATRASQRRTETGAFRNSRPPAYRSRDAVVTRAAR